MPKLYLEENQDGLNVEIEGTGLEIMALLSLGMVHLLDQGATESNLRQTIEVALLTRSMDNNDKKAAPGAANTSDGKGNTYQPKYTTPQAATQEEGLVVALEMANALEELFGGRGKL